MMVIFELGYKDKGDCLNFEESCSNNIYSRLKCVNYVLVLFGKEIYWQVALLFVTEISPETIQRYLHHDRGSG